jgi:DNA-binding transcriptional LysR family regulator
LQEVASVHARIITRAAPMSIPAVRMRAMRLCMGSGTLRTLNWDDLRFFVAVARAGSMSAAARALGVAQPTVGRRIAALERELGAKLLIPTTSGQKLSPTGHRTLAHAEEMERSALAAERIASGQDAGLSGRVRITASEWLVESVLAPRIAPFIARHPDLEVELVADPQHSNLSRREADIALRPSRFEHQAVIQREVAVVSFGLYASAEYLKAHGAPDFRERCEGHTIIELAGMPRRTAEADWLASIASDARVVARVNGRQAMAAMLRAGAAIGCLPRFLGDAEGLQLLGTPTPGPRRQLWMGVHRDVRTIPRVKGTMNFLAARFEEVRSRLAP